MQIVRLIGAKFSSVTKNLIFKIQPLSGLISNKNILLFTVKLSKPCKTEPTQSAISKGKEHSSEVKQINKNR